MIWRAGSREGWRRALRAGLRRFVRARGGGVAMMTAVALPPLLLIGVGAVELQGVASDRAATQAVADQAALWGAQQLGVTPVGVEARTQSWAAPQLQGILARADVTVKAEVQQGGLMKVSIDTHRPSFFMNLMPAGGFYTHADATAQSINRLPLCVLTFGDQTSNQAHLAGGSLIKAPACMMHAKGEIKVDGLALLNAGAVETESGRASGQIMPSAGTDAPAVPDPFAGMSISFPAPCTGGPAITVSQSKPVTLQPPSGQSWMVVQGKIGFSQQEGPLSSDAGGVLTLKPGEYYFCQDLVAAGGSKARAQQTLLGPASKHALAPAPGLVGGLVGAVTSPITQPTADTASIVGDDVVLIFADGRKLNLQSGSSITLNGRKSGALAGFVLVAGLTGGDKFTLNSDQVQSLLGTVYVRKTALQVTGTAAMASAAAWTVIVANSLALEQNAPGVLINANYASSTVPRPSGVGDAATSSNSRLVR